MAGRFLTGDNEHVQAVMGVTQGGSGYFNNPLTEGSQDDRHDVVISLLKPFRTIENCAAAFGSGPPAAIASRTFSSKPLDGRNGESRRFTEVQVRTATFVVAWLRWLPDYIVKGAGAGATNSWWKDDNADFTLPRSFMRMAGGASNLTGGGVRPTTILCDFSATAGAELFDAKWMTERDMEGALLLHTRAIVQSPQDYSIPGWVSVEKALDFLKEEAGKEDRGPLSAFLRSAGVN